MPAEPGEPDVKASENVRAIGAFWIVAEGEVRLASGPIRTLLTIGYDPEQREFIGTWIDSTSSFLWTYRGALDATGKTLTLEAEGPGLQGGSSRYRDVIEFKDRDHKLLTNFVEGENGEWTALASVTYRRTK